MERLEISCEYSLDLQCSFISRNQVHKFTAVRTTKAIYSRRMPIFNMLDIISYLRCHYYKLAQKRDLMLTFYFGNIHKKGKEEMK